MPTSISKDHVTLRVGTHIADKIGKRKFSMWFGESASLDYDAKANRLVVGAANRFVADWINDNFADAVRQAVRQELDESASISVEVSADNLNKTNQKPKLNKSNSSDNKSGITKNSKSYDDSKTLGSSASSIKKSNLRYCLDDFVVGKCNELAFASASRLASGDDNSGHPLFIHGGCGLGKTHLLQGICRRLNNHKKNAKVIYTTGERFTNEYISAIKSNKLNGFRRRMRKLDLLAVDDVHFIAGKQATQQEFLHSFDEIELGGAKLVLASDSHPKWIKQFSKALASRCIRGMVVKVNEPDITTRSLLIKNLSKRKNLYINDSIADILSSRCSGSVRDIEGTLNQLTALCRLSSSAKTGSAARGAINYNKQLEVDRYIIEKLFSQLPTQRKKPVCFKDIITEVTNQTGISFAQITSSSRQRQVVGARSIAVYLARELTSMSYPEIAGALDKKNHSSIVEAVKRIKRQMDEKQSIIFSLNQTNISICDLAQNIKAQILS